MAQLTMEKLVNLAKGRGFVYAGSEIYGGLSNSWDYGPLGVEMKNNIGRFAATKKGHMVFFPHGFVDPLTGAKMSRLFLDDAHWEKLSSLAAAAGQEFAISLTAHRRQIPYPP